MGIDRKQTIRQDIIELLEQGDMTIRDISQGVSITEKDVPHHLGSIEKSLKHKNKRLLISPCRCLACGFEFKRSFKRPGKCPACRKGRIEPALFRIEKIH